MSAKKLTEPQNSMRSEPDGKCNVVKEVGLRPIVGRDSQNMVPRSPLAVLTINSNNSHDEKIQPRLETKKANEVELHLVDDLDFFRYKQVTTQTEDEDIDFFGRFSDEIILQIFAWLPKKTLMRCSQVCTRFNRIVHTDILWTRLDLGGRHIKAEALGHIISRGVVILRLAQTNISDPILNFSTPEVNWDTFQSKLQYLDLSMATISLPSLQLLLSKCRKLKKLSLEHAKVNDEVCFQLSKNKELETLNMTMCEGLTVRAVITLMQKLQELRSLNISWTCLDVTSLEALIMNITPEILRLNISGCKRTMTDKHLKVLANRCTKLIALEIADSNELTTAGVESLAKLKNLEYLSLARCYNVEFERLLTPNLLPSLLYLNVFGVMNDDTFKALETAFPAIEFNKFIHSSIARPTIGNRRTSIWGLRTRD